MTELPPTFGEALIHKVALAIAREEARQLGHPEPLSDDDVERFLAMCKEEHDDIELVARVAINAVLTELLREASLRE